MMSVLAWDVQLDGEGETVLSMQVEHGPPVRLQLTSQPGCELLTVTNGANEAGRMLLETAVLQLQDSFGNCCYVQDVVGSVALEPSDGKAQGTNHKPVLLSAAHELEHNKTTRPSPGCTASSRHGPVRKHELKRAADAAFTS